MKVLRKIFVEKPETRLTSASIIPMPSLQDKKKNYNNNILDFSLPYYRLRYFRMYLNMRFFTSIVYYGKNILVMC